jgi:hypothetical protein
LFGWIKSAIGLDKTESEEKPARPLEVADSDVGREAAPPPVPPVPPVQPIPAGAPVESTQAEPQAEGLISSNAAPAAASDEIDAVAAISAESVVDIRVEVAAPIEVAPPPPIEVEVERAPIVDIEPDGPPTQAEIDRRRAMVRGFFNDYWSSVDDKPASFAERLDRAESYINERVAARGEAWRLGPMTRKLLGLPPSKGR